MTLLGRHDDRDPFDFSRLMIAEALRKILDYGDLCERMIHDRDDDGFDLARRGLVAHVRALQTHSTALAAAHVAEPGRTAAAHFDRQPAPAPRHDTETPA